jgi:tRNA-dihydrouridine synthase
MQNILETMYSGIILSELGGHGDGIFCARHGAGAALVMMGTYIIDENLVYYDYSPDFVFTPMRSSYDSYLKENIAKAGSSGALVGVSAASVKIEDSLEFFKSAVDSGTDCVSLCLHSTLDIFVRSETSAALCHRKNWSRLREWVEALLKAVRVPIIFKVGLNDSPDILGAVEIISGAGISIVHVDCENAADGSKGFLAIRDFKCRTHFLIVSGGVKDIEDVRRVIDAGADAVAVGSAALKDSGLCGRLQKRLNADGTGRRKVA